MKKQNKDWYQAKSDYYDKIRIKCKCGHSLIIPVFVDKQICSWCGHLVYRNKKLEFKVTLAKKIKENK